MKKAFFYSIATRAAEWACLIIGSTLTSIGIYFFEFLNHFATGGVSGISVLLGVVFPSVSAGSFMFLINLLLLLVGFLVIGKNFGTKTVFCSALISAETLLFEHLFSYSTPLTNEPLLELTFAVLLSSLGTGMILYYNGSTGGTDIVAMVIKKLTDFRVWVGLFISDLLIVSLSFYVFGLKTWLLSLLGFLARILVLNQFLSRINTSKYCTVICDSVQSEAICNFVTQRLKKSATVGNCFFGAYQRETKCVLFIALTRKQAGLLKRYLRSLDESIFMIVCKTDEISGYGFREPL